MALQYSRINSTYSSDPLVRRKRLLGGGESVTSASLDAAGAEEGVGGAGVKEERMREGERISAVDEAEAGEA